MITGTDYIGIAVVFYCHDGNGNVVLAKRGVRTRDEHGSWDIGGGKIEMNETAVDQMKTEIREEYCAEVVDFSFLGYRDVQRGTENERTHWITIDFKVLLDHNEVKNGEPEKFDDVQWFPMSDLPTPLHSQLPRFLEKYADML